MDAARTSLNFALQARSQACEISLLNRLDIAHLMARLKPDWWDVNEAMQQLSENNGWYLRDESGAATGWLMAHQQVSCRTVEIESLGFDHDGELIVGPELAPLVLACEDWGLYSGMANSRYIMGSLGLSVHDLEVSSPAEALSQLENYNRPDYDWFLSMGYVPCGILPQIYGHNYHGILLVKELRF